MLFYEEAIDRAVGSPDLGPVARAMEAANPALEAAGIEPFGEWVLSESSPEGRVESLSDRAFEYVEKVRSLGKVKKGAEYVSTALSLVPVGMSIIVALLIVFDVTEYSVPVRILYGMVYVVYGAVASMIAKVISEIAVDATIARSEKKAIERASKSVNEAMRRAKNEKQRSDLGELKKQLGELQSVS